MVFPIIGYLLVWLGSLEYILGRSVGSRAQELSKGGLLVVLTGEPGMSKAPDLDGFFQVRWKLAEHSRDRPTSLYVG